MLGGKSSGEYKDSIIDCKSKDQQNEKAGKGRYFELQQNKSKKHKAMHERVKRRNSISPKGTAESGSKAGKWNGRSYDGVVGVY